MRFHLHRVLAAVLALTAASASAQMHKVARPEQVVRAVGVYEWTGDFAKPNASRLIPVSLYIDGEFQDAGVYVARPVPFALLSGNVYELQSAGVSKGLLDLVYARHLEATSATGDLAYDDGWFGYGKVEPLAAPRKTAALKASKTLPVLQSSVKDTAASGADPDRPTMKRRSSSGSDSGSSSTTSTTPGTSDPADDPDRPTMKRRDSSGASATAPDSTTATGKSSTPADDPDRPAMKRRDSSDAGAGSAASTTASSADPANDPDRPTLKRRTPEEARKVRNANDGVSTTGYESLNDDPNRPNLHYGKPTHALTETDLPKLTGLPQNLHQMVAVSDAVNRDPHSFVLTWDDASQHAAILAKMQALARAQLAAYGNKSSATTPPPIRKTSTRAHRTAKPAPPPIALMDEELKAYTLSYGGDPTYIYSAHTAGTGAALRYVTIVAQSDSLGQFKPAIQSVTDAAHLDDKPSMRFIDAVDADAGNRASLLFELRGQTARQFALYRVIAAHSDQIFLTGTTQ